MQSDLIQILKKRLKHPILIKKKENLLYLTGRSFDYRAEEYLLILPLTPTLSHKGRGGDSVIGFGSGLEQIDWVKKSDRLKNIGQYLKGYKQLDIEYGFTYGEGEYLKYKISSFAKAMADKSDLGYKILVKPERSLVDVMRQIKSMEELSKIKKSMQIVEKVFALVRKEVKKSGMTERKLADFITKTGYKFGAHDVSFPAIIASRANAAIPHHVPSNKFLKAGESIIIDFGFKYKNYCSDFTRTVFLKKVPKKLEIAYNQVEKAYNGSMEYISNPSRARPRDPSKQEKGILPPHQVRGLNGNTITGNDVYQKVVDILAEKKLDKYFIHSLGHGTGLEIHELPNLSPDSKDELKNGMVFSIEPGVYIPKLGGIRIEDLVYLQNGKVNKFINVSAKLKDNIL